MKKPIRSNAIVLLIAMLAVIPSAHPALAAAQTLPPQGAANSSSSSYTSSASRQLAWIVEQSTHLPLTAAEAEGHLSPGLRTPEKLAEINGVLQQMVADGPLAVSSIRQQHLREDTQNFALLATNTQQWHAVVITSPDGILQYIDFRALPTTWAAFEDRLAAIAPNTAYVVTDATNKRATVISQQGANESQPIASGFKLWVLGALAESVNKGEADWDETLAVRDEWKAGMASPVGSLPAGTSLTLREYASNMMYFSDNSATDHLMHRLGISAIERQQHKMGVAQPLRNIPMLTTRQMTILKASADYPALAGKYSSLSTEKEKRKFLAEVVDKQPLPATSWKEPRAISQIEWFASAKDISRGFAYLKRLDGHGANRGEISKVLSPEGTTGLGFDTQQWPVGWFKGGSEPGVMSRSYYAHNKDGRHFVVSILANDPVKTINYSARASELQTLAAGAFYLARNDQKTYPQ